MKDYKTLAAVVIMLVVAYLVFLMPRHETEVGEGVSVVKDEQIKIRPVDAAVGESDWQSVEPKWKKWSRVREVSDPKLGVVLGDLESHMPKGHDYTDDNKMTWAHETTHGINANIRRDINSSERFNGFYVLQDRAFVLKEPPITIKDVAQAIPEVLRGPSYKLYLVEQADSWNDRPLYIFDEWVSYTNGSEVGKELNVYGWYYELLQAHNFNVYCTYLAMVVQRDSSDYRDAELKKFLMWNTERVFRISLPSDRIKVDKTPDNPVKVSSKHICPHVVLKVGEEISLQSVEEYLNKVRTAPEAEKFRKFAREYFGASWCKRIYGF